MEKINGVIMALITKDEVLRIARMSRIALYEQEIEPVTAQLNGILSYAVRVEEIAGKGEIQDTQNSNVFRADTVVPCNGQRLVDASAGHEEHYFVVPAIIEHE